MTIVASNSITVSNVNDGTITHIAYSNIKFLCNESQNFTLSEQSVVRFGVDTRWVYKEIQAGTYTASWPFFGSDPASGVWKHAELVSNFSNSNSINTTHIGVYVDFVESNSVDPSKYNWTIFKGNDGVGVKSTDITYANSTSGTTAPSAGWTSSVPTLVKGQYLWTKTVWTYTDASSKTGYSVTYISKDGINGTNGTSGVIVSSVAPTSPQTGQLWQDTSTTPQIVKKWTGSSWVIWELYAQNLKADTLETLSAKIGKIYNEFEYEASGSLNKGSITIENDIQFTTENLNNVNHPKTNIALSANTNFTGLQVQYLPNNDASGGHQTAYYTYGGIYMQDNINGWAGNITAEALHNKGWKNITGFINGVQTDAVPLQYKVTINMDNTRTIKFRGGFKGSGTSNIPQAAIVQLPVEARPTTTIAFPCMGSGARLARIIIGADGWIQFNVAAGSSISGFNGVLLSNVFYEI